jgi:hypothetical protein
MKSIQFLNLKTKLLNGTIFLVIDKGIKMSRRGPTPFSDREN